MYDTIVAFLDSIKNDPTLSQRIIGALPTDIHEIFLHEKEQAGNP
jgi:hypothetical protein